MASRVSIIGTAGRRGAYKKMDKQLYRRMVGKAAKVVTEEFGLGLGGVHLVSGGAAWADHIAVTLFLDLMNEIPSLTLHFPSKWENHKKPQFTNNGKGSPGASANTHHKHFSDKIKENSLEQIDLAIQTGASYQVHKGFHERNTHVAQSEYLVAFTWDEGSEPTKGGTLDTWKKCTGRKLHIPLSSLEPQALPSRKRPLSHESEDAVEGKTLQKKLCFSCDRS